MRNRLPPNSAKGVPDEIVQEYNTLCWIGRALEDLGHNPRYPRSIALREQLLALCDTSLETDVTPPDKQTHPKHAAEGLVDDLDLRTPWYNGFVIPEVMINWLSNLRVWVALVFLGVLVPVVVILHIFG